MKDNFKIAVFYFTQTGQLLEILKSLLDPLVDYGCEVIYKEIAPVEPFPFPWSSAQFYEVFPESRAEISFPLKPTNFDDILDANLVVLGYQPWYLAPSIPIASFLKEKSTGEYLKGRDVITVAGTRNMWISALKSIKLNLEDAGADLVTNIALEDRHNNLVSVLTIFRWLINNKKEATLFLPAAGVSADDIKRLSLLSEDLYNAIKESNYLALQKRVVEVGALKFNPHLYFIENNGNKIWGSWAKWVLKRGAYGDPHRRGRLKLFKFYLLTLIFVISPFGSLFFKLTWPLRKRSYIAIENNIMFLHTKK